MRQTSEMLRRVFKRLDGAKFRAILASANDGATNDRTTFRVIFVKNPCFVSAGDVIKGDGGQTFILMEHPNDTPLETNFKAAYVERPVQWRRKFKQNDSVTGVPKDAGNWVNMGPLYVNFDMPENAPVEALSDTRYRFLSGQGVLVGDEVDGKIVKLLYSLLGVKLGFAD